MELIKSFDYYCCLLQFPNGTIIPFLKIQEGYPINYLEIMSYLDNADPKNLDNIIQHIEQDVFMHKKRFVLDQYQTTLVVINSEYSEVYEQFTRNILFRMETQFFMDLLKKWRDFCVDFQKQQWRCVPRDQVKPEYLSLLEQRNKPEDLNL